MARLFVSRNESMNGNAPDRLGRSAARRASVVTGVSILGSVDFDGDLPVSRLSSSRKIEDEWKRPGQVTAGRRLGGMTTRLGGGGGHRGKADSSQDDAVLDNW